MAADTLIELMEARASDTGPFLISPETGAELSFRRFREEAHRVAGQIAAEGIQPGDRVAIAVSNGIEVLLAFFGATEAGAMAMPLNPDLKPDEYDFALEHSGSRLTICAPGTLDRVRAKAGTGKRQDSIVGISFNPRDGATLEGGRGGSASLQAAPGPDAEALLLYTSGTTSAPKGVEISHRNLTVSAKNVAEWYNLSERDVTACVMPLFHVHGLVASVMASLLSGGTVIVPQRFSASNFWPIIRAYGVTRATSITQMRHERPLPTVGSGQGISHAWMRTAMYRSLAESKSSSIVAARRYRRLRWTTFWLRIRRSRKQ